MTRFPAFRLQEVQRVIRPEELAATIYHALDIPINDPTDASGLSRTLTTGKPVMELFR